LPIESTSISPAQDIVADEDKVAVRHSLQGTHLATFQGIPATGRSVAVNAIVLFHMENGKAAELWLNADFLGLMQQLGAIPMPEMA
jgi:predicted ester cyclase